MRTRGRARRMRLAALLVAAASLALFPSGASQAQGTGDTWATRASMPTPRYLLVLGAAAAPNGKLYAIGGLGNGILATVEEYNPATDTWATKRPMPSNRAGLGVATANGKLYAIGGEAGGILASVEEYDPRTDTWATKRPMPTARRGLGVAAASNGKLYAIGGVNSIAALATVEEYDPGKDTWTSKKPMPAPRYNLAVVASALNGKVYAIGGLGSGPLARVTVEEYDPDADTWATKRPMPTGRYDVAAAAAPNGKLYAIGGFNGNPGALATVEQYDPAADKWATRAPMPTARYSLGVAAASNGKLYAVGGLNGIALATVEEYDPGTGVDPTPATVDLAPADDVKPVGTSHTVTATVKDAGAQPLPAISVRFRVQGSVSTTGACTTNTSGQCGFTYAGPQLPGADAIAAYADTNANNTRDTGEPQATATNAWILPTTTPGQVTGAGQVANGAGNDQAAFGFTARSDGGALKGECSVVDPATKTHVKCLDVTALTQSGTQATIFGNASVNGSPTTYRIDVEDKADPGRGQDTFRIQSASGFTAGGLLSQGNVQIQK